MRTPKFTLRRVWWLGSIWFSLLGSWFVQLLVAFRGRLTGSRTDFQARLPRLLRRSQGEVAVIFTVFQTSTSLVVC